MDWSPAVKEMGVMMVMMKLKVILACEATTAASLLRARPAWRAWPTARHVRGPTRHEAGGTQGRLAMLMTAMILMIGVYTMLRSLETIKTCFRFIVLALCLAHLSKVHSQTRLRFWEC